MSRSSLANFLLSSPTSQIFLVSSWFPSIILVGKGRLWLPKIMRGIPPMFILFQMGSVFERVCTSLLPQSLCMVPLLVDSLIPFADFPLLIPVISSDYLSSAVSLETVFFPCNRFLSASLWVLLILLQTTIFISLLLSSLLFWSDWYGTLIDLFLLCMTL